MHQDGLLVEFLEILSESDVPIFSNMTADNLPDDNMVRMLRLFYSIFSTDASSFFSSTEPWLGERVVNIFERSQTHKDADLCWKRKGSLINIFRKGFEEGF